MAVNPWDVLEDVPAGAPSSDPWDVVEDAPLSFDPYGPDYDMSTAEQRRITADETGHYPSLAPLSPDEAKDIGLPAGSGLVLKGKNHPTFHKTEEAERALGRSIIEKNGRLYSVPGTGDEDAPAEHPAARGLDAGSRAWDIVEDAPAAPTSARQARALVDIDTRLRSAQALLADPSIDDGVKRNAELGIANLKKKREQVLRMQPQEGPAGFFDKLAEVGDDISQVVPFLGQVAEADRIKAVYDSVERIKQGQDTADDQELVRNFLKASELDAKTDKTLGYHVANILSQLPAFVSEFALTGGIYTAGKKAASKAITTLAKEAAEEGAKKSLARRGAEAATGALAQTPVAMGGRIYSGTVERLVEGNEFSEDEAGKLHAVLADDADGFGTAMTKSFGDAYIEMLSERSGAVVPEIWKRVPGNQKVAALKAAVIDRWFKNAPNPTVDKFLKTIRGRGGWHGVIGEMFEERAGEALRYATGIEEEYQPAALYRQGELGKMLLAEAIAFSVPGAIGATARQLTTDGRPTTPESDAAGWEPIEDLPAGAVPETPGAEGERREPVIDFGEGTPAAPVDATTPTVEPAAVPQSETAPELALSQPAGPIGRAAARAPAIATTEAATASPTAPAVAPAPADRRQDIGRRRRVSEMSLEEAQRELLTDPLTELPNRRAYGEAEQKPVQAAIDLDSLKFVNDTLGHEAGDRMLQTIGQALREEGVESYRIGGDEFIAQGADQATIDRALAAVAERLENAEIVAELPDGTAITKKGVHFSYGLGATRNEADQALGRSKAEREAKGLRAGRGETPRGVRRIAPGEQDQGDQAAASQAEVTQRKPAAPEAPSPEGVPASAIDEAAHEAATSPKNDLPEPTEAQKDAGVYKKGHVRIHGLDISIENPKGSTRSGTDRDGKAWSVEMSAHYGYIRRSEGADGEQVDVYLADGTAAPDARVFVVDQIDAESGEFDETKSIIGVESEDEAARLYDAHFSDGKGPQRRAAITELTIDEFKRWIEEGDSDAPVKEWALQEGKKAPEIRDREGKKVATQARAVGEPDVRALAQRQRQMQKPQEPVLPQLRREGDQDVRGVVRELPGVSDGRRAEAEPKAHAGPERQRRQLRAGERPLVNEEGTGAQHEKESPADIQRKDTDVDRMGRGDRAGPIDTAIPTETRRDVDRGGVEDEAQGREAPRKPIAQEEGAVARTPAGSVPRTAPTVADRIRKLIGLDIAKINAYSPEAAVSKLGRRWTYTTIDGNSGDHLLDTRRDAVEAATRHKELKLDQHENPEDYFDLTSLLARERLKLIEKYMADGMTEMEAGARARKEIPDETESQAPEREPQTGEQITDVGEKIGGARKDLAEGTGPRVTREKSDAPGWRSRYEVAQIAKSTASGEEGRWVVHDKRREDWRGRSAQVGERSGYATKEEAEAAIALIAVSRNHRVVPVTVKRELTEADVDAMVERDSAAAQASVGTEESIAHGVVEKAKRRLKAGEITQAQYDGIVEKFGEAAARYTPAELTRLPASETKWEIWRDISDRKRVKVVAQQFESRDDALRYMARHATEIIETKTSFGEEILPVPDKVRREGPVRRTGNVKGDDFMRAFRFRAVEFGNWENQEERQQVMNHAYDALGDLAETLDVPPRAIGLNGELALAFGARGHGLTGARAHYETSYGVINLTKMKGAGSLAHEWFHALDHYLARQDTKATREKVRNRRGDLVYPEQSTDAQMVSHGFRGERSGVRPELRAAYDHVIDTMLRKAEKFVEDTEQADRFVARTREDVAKALADIRKDLAEQKDVRYWKRNNKPASAEQLAEFDTIAGQIIAGDFLETEWRATDTTNKSRLRLRSGRWTNDALEKISAIYKAVRGRSGFGSAQSRGILDSLRGDMQRYSARLKMLADAQRGEEKTKKVPTSFAMEAKSIDQGRATGYWTTPHEMAARAFQAYVEDKIGEQGGRSDFLTYGTRGLVIPTPWGWAKPFPEGTEREAINAAFDRFVETLETKETDKGVVLFSSVPAGWEKVEAEPGKRLTAAEVRKSIEPILRKWKNAPTINIIDHPAQLPGDLHVSALRHARLHVGGTAEGMRLIRGMHFKRGDREGVYIFAGNIPTIERAHETLLHEVVGHYGLRGAFGKRWDDALERIWNYYGRDGLATIAESYGFDLNTREGRLRAADEQFARLVEKWGDKQLKGGDLTLFQRVIIMLRNLLRELGFRFKKMAKAEWQDLANMLIAAQRFVASGGRAVAGADGVSFASATVRPHQLQGIKNGKIVAVAVPKPNGSWEIYWGSGPTLMDSRQFRRQSVASPEQARREMERAGLSVKIPRRPSTQGPAPAPLFKGFDVPAERVFDYLARKFQDKFRRVKLLERAISKYGGVLDEDTDAYLAEELSYGRTEDKLRRFDEQYVEPLIEAIKKEKVSIEDVDRYLYAKHAPERNTHIAEINPYFRENDIPGSGMSDIEAADILADFRERGMADRLDRVAQKVYSINEARLRLLEREGLESAETLRLWREPYKFYVPLRGFQEETQDDLPRTGRGFDIRGRESRRALGRSRLAESPLTYTIAQMEESIIRGEKNEVGKTFLKLVEANPNPELWEINKVEYKPRYDERTGEVVYAPDLLHRLADNVLSVKVDGKQVLITLHDDLLARALKNVGIERTNQLVRALGSVNRFLALVNTALNPEFVVSNFTRDLQTAIINLYGEQGAPSNLRQPEKIARKVLKDLPLALAGAYAGLRGLDKAAFGTAKRSEKVTRWARWFDEYRAAGGKIGFFGLDTIEAKRKRLHRAVKLAEGGAAAQAETIIRAFGDLIMDVNGAVENGVRLAAYANARELGLSEKQAASLARNLTVNFNRKGELGILMNSAYLFYNASLQGGVRLLYALRSPKVRKVVGGIVVGAFLLAELNRWIAGDDDDGENFYDKIDPWIKEHNLILMKADGKGGYYSIPLPYGYNVPHVIGTGINDILHTGNPAKVATRTVIATFNAFNPLGSDAGLVQMVSPTILDPFVQVATNENFYGAPIKPEQRGYGPQKPESQLYWNTVSPVSKAITDKLNELTGGNTVRPGLIDMSPEVLDHMVGTFFGGAGAFVNRSVNAIEIAIGPDEVPTRKIPFVRRFVGEQSEYYVPRRFRENVNEILLAHEEVEALQEQRKHEAARQARQRNKPLLRLYEEARSLNREVSEMRRQIRDVREAKHLSEDEQRRRVDRLEERLEQRMKRFNKRFNETVGAR